MCCPDSNIMIGYSGSCGVIQAQLGKDIYYLQATSGCRATFLVCKLYRLGKRNCWIWECNVPYGVNSFCFYGTRALIICSYLAFCCCFQSCINTWMVWITMSRDQMKWSASSFLLYWFISSLFAEGFELVTFSGGHSTRWVRGDGFWAKKTEERALEEAKEARNDLNTALDPPQVEVES
jgi:hypothetical protein